MSHIQDKINRTLEKRTQQISKIFSTPYVLASGKKGDLTTPASTSSGPGITRYFKYIAVIIGLLLIGFVASTLLTPRSNISIQLNFTDASGTGLSDVNVTVAGQQSISDTLGNAKVSLAPGNYQITASKNNYQQLTQPLVVLNSEYTKPIRRSFIMVPGNGSNISGNLTVKQPQGYNFIGDRVTVNGKEFPVSANGTFTLTDVPEGNYDITFLSSNFKDHIWKQFAIKSGNNTLPAIELQPAGDIVGDLKDFVTEKTVKQVQLTIEGIDSSQLTISDSGAFRFKDLEIGRKYLMRVSGTAYLTRDYEYLIAQGENRLQTFSLVPKGGIIFGRKDGQGRNQLYVSDLDGGNPRLITQQGQEIINAQTAKDPQLAYFLSKVGARHQIMSIPILGGQPVDLTKSIPEYEVLFKPRINYVAEKFVTEYSGRQSKEKFLEIRNFIGSGIVKINSTTNGNFVTPTIADNGEYLVYGLYGDPVSSKNGFFRINVNTNQSKTINQDKAKTIFDVSADGRRVLYSIIDPGLNVENLKYSDIETGETEVIMQVTGSNYQFQKGSNDLIIYRDVKDGRSNIYRRGIASNQTETLTNNGNVAKIFQQGRYIMYYIMFDLYVMDPETPQDLKLVAKNVEIYEELDSSR